MISSSLTLVVHLGSLFAFCVLFFLQVRNRRKNELLSEYLRGDFKARVQLDWPLRFLSRFCEALHVPFSGKGSLSALSPKRLRKEVLFETLLLYGIDAIEYDVGPHGRVQVNLRVSKRVSNHQVLEEELTRALNIDIKITSSFIKEL
jgi:hypothetical protein